METAEIKEVKKEIKKMPARKFKRFKKPLKILGLVIAVLIILGGIFSLFLNKTNYGKVLKTAWQIQKQQQVSEADKKVLEQLSKIMLLPGDVTPTMAVITDAEILRKQQPVFFKDAKNDDHLIIYPDIAIIFDAKANKIIKVGPVQTTATQPKTETTSTPAPKN